MEGKEELKELENEIEALAKELNIEEKHLKRIFDGSYSSISLTKRTPKKQVILLAHLSHKVDGKVRNPLIKATKDDNLEFIKKMQKFMTLARFYISLRKAKDIEARVKEGLAVSLAS